MKERIFLTGASGFIGQTLLPVLINNGFDVRSLDRKEGDLLSFNPEILDNTDIVLHLASLIHGSKEDFQKTNVKGTLRLIKLAEEKGIKKFVYISTLNVKNCSSYYALSKKQAEKLVSDSSLNYIIIRPALVFGRGKDGGVYKIIPWIKKGIVPIIGNGKNKFHPLYVKDLADLIVSVLKNNNIERKTYEAGGGKILEFNDLVKELAEVFGKKPLIFHIPFKFLINKDFFKNKTADNSLAEKDFSFNPREFKQGLKKYLL